MPCLTPDDYLSASSESNERSCQTSEHDGAHDELDKGKVKRELDQPP